MTDPEQSLTAAEWQKLLARLEGSSGPNEAMRKLFEKHRPLPPPSHTDTFEIQELRDMTDDSDERKPPFAPWLIERKDNGLFDLYGTVDHNGKPWRKPQILAVDVDPTVASWLAAARIASPPFGEALAIWRAERGLDAGADEDRRSVLDAVIAGLERRNAPRSMIDHLKKRFEERLNNGEDLLAEGKTDET